MSKKKRTKKKERPALSKYSILELSEKIEFLWRPHWLLKHRILRKVHVKRLYLRARISMNRHRPCSVVHLKVISNSEQNEYPLHLHRRDSDLNILETFTFAFLRLFIWFLFRLFYSIHTIDCRLYILDSKMFDFVYANEGINPKLMKKRKRVNQSWQRIDCVFCVCTYLCVQWNVVNRIDNKFRVQHPILFSIVDNTTVAYL